MKMTLESAVEAINRHGVLLTFPIDNQSDPPALWSVFYPRSQMRWEWEANADNRVPKLWHLKTELSASRQVVYTKRYKGRATFFSKTLFKALLRFSGSFEAEKALSCKANSTKHSTHAQ